MSKYVIRDGWRISEAMIKMGAELEQEFGIEPLRKGERRPDGYYTPNHYISWGRRSRNNAKKKDS